MDAKAKYSPDMGVMLLALLLCCIGIVLVFSTSSLIGYGREGADAAFYLKRSVVHTCLGLCAMYGASKIKPQYMVHAAYPALIASVLFLCLPWIPGIGRSVNGAARWARLPGLSFQPSDVAKLGLIVFLAHSLAKRGDAIKSFAYGFLPNLLLASVPIALVLVEPDLGTAVLMAGVAVSMAFAAGVRLRHLGLLFLTAAPFVWGLLWFVDFRRARILAFLDPWKHAKGAAYQLVQSLVAFGVGGVWGVGLGAGKQKLHYLPEAHTDFILSVLAEERGLIGIIAVLIIVSALIWRGFGIAARQTDPFCKYFAAGIVSCLGLQAALNSLVVMGCLPTKGFPFPFLSYGGTGLVINLTAVGFLAGLGARRAR